jgi:T-complex protein 1 subunit zeta
MAQVIAKNTESVRQFQALAMNINAGKGLQKVLQSNLGPRGTLKMLVSGGGDIKITKDGHVLLQEMQIQHPTAALIARSASSQDKVCGDGTTTEVILIGEILHQCERFLVEGLHPRLIIDGIELAKDRLSKFLDESKVVSKEITNQEFLCCVAKTTMLTKISEKVVDKLTPIVVNAVKTIMRPEVPIDLHMIEIISMQHSSDSDCRLINGLALDHGARNPDMPKKVTDAHILTCNISLEPEKHANKAEVRIIDAESREKMLAMERQYIDQRVMKIIELKRHVCEDNSKGFVIINEKGIDPAALSMLANEGILALRRAKRRNMERCTKACGGDCINSIDDLSPNILGFAKSVYEHNLGEEKYTFIEGVENPFSCTILVKGPNKHTIQQIKDTIYDGLRSVKNTIEDGAVLLGGGSFEMSAYLDLLKFKDTVPGRMKLGVQAIADSLLIVPKTLCINSGFDVIDTIIKLEDEHKKGKPVGLNVYTGDPIDPKSLGIYDGFRVKRNLILSSISISTQLLLVDEVLITHK